MKQLSSRIISLLASLAVVISSLPLPGWSAGPTSTLPAFVQTLTPPEKFGMVASSYDAGGAKQPRLIVIADLHAHMGVQNNILGRFEDRHH